eukprot:CAMPEP_0174703278 /NCGR_PEP_ID=MMETSP1094-20130205/7281_1 /TAXON_ID=156173 /ORGANISM="Chrysochromulina brevifilum, Strain UTEX LB 985" /LENGTH=131 /DNA_ID=CAMNT_0015901171 /DNA_START=178 /DNA_END=569 /DNA_ORIENTATION=-
MVYGEMVHPIPSRKDDATRRSSFCSSRGRVAFVRGSGAKVNHTIAMEPTTAPYRVHQAVAVKASLMSAPISSLFGSGRIHVCTSRPISMIARRELDECTSDAALSCPPEEWFMARAHVHMQRSPAHRRSGS